MATPQKQNDKETQRKPRQLEHDEATSLVGFAGALDCATQAHSDREERKNLFGNAMFGAQLALGQLALFVHTPNMDMLGNAFEWTQDCWSETHIGAPGDGSPRFDGACKFRVMKGGSWVTYAEQVRAAKRTQYTTDYRYDDYGFRIARTIPD